MNTPYSTINPPSHILTTINPFHNLHVLLYLFHRLCVTMMDNGLWIGSVLRCRVGKDSSRWVNQMGAEGSPVSPPSFRSSSIAATKDGTKGTPIEGKKVGTKDMVKEGEKDGLQGVPKGVSPLPGMLPAHHKVGTY